MTRWIANENSKVFYKGEIVYIAEYADGCIFLTLHDDIIVIEGVNFILAFGPRALKAYLEELGMDFNGIW